MEAVLVAAVVVVSGAVVWRLRRRHPGVPRGWQTAQSEAAILHRRLHQCVDSTRHLVARVGARGIPVAQLVSLSEDLHTQALAVDRQLVTASRLPDGARHKALIGLKWRIMETEKLASRIRDLAVDMARPDFDDADAGIHHLRQRLDALDEARREAHGIGGPLPDADERDDEEGRQA